MITNETKEAIKAKISQLQSEKDDIVKGITELESRKQSLVLKREALIARIKDLRDDLPVNG